MVRSADDDQDVEQRFYELCADLNMDKNTSMEAWQTYLRIGHNYTLEGDPLHWLVCALYVACRSSSVPTVGGKPGSMIEGNCVSLTRLLRSCKFSLIQFFTKMKKWSDMASLPQDFRKKIDRLEKNFAVSTVIFKKFRPIFLETFKEPTDDVPRPRNRKQKRIPCSSADVFSFCWTLFVQVKSNFTAISDDLVNSYHLLLSCVDFVYNNVLLADRRDLLNLNFTGLPEGFNTREYNPPTEHACIIRLLCEKHDGLYLEAKGIKEHWWKPHIKKLFDLKLLKGNAETMAGLLDHGNFEANNKSVNNSYELYVLNVGDFDERIFLAEGAVNEIGINARSSLALTGDLGEKMQMKRNLQQHMDTTKSLTLHTPLTGRRFLTNRDVGSVTPVSTATQSVTKLQTLLSGRKTSPSDALIDIFKECRRNPMDNITRLIKEMGEKFCTHYVQPSDDHLGSHIDFAKKRLQLGESLYYKALESNMVMEKKRLPPNFDFTVILEQEVFHRSLFACCLEIVIFSYNSQRIFPWIIGIFDIEPYYFYKVIEVLIRAEEGLPRDVVKHLNHIEEQIFESLAWKCDSVLWSEIKDSGNPIPTCEEVSLPNPADQSLSSTAQQNLLSSPAPHPSIRRLALDRSASKSPQSPVAPSLTDRFQSPNANGTVNSAKRRLFGPVTVSRAVTVTTPTLSATSKPQAGETVLLSTSQGMTTVLSPQKTLTFVQSQGEGGSITYFPAQYVTIPVSSALVSPASNPTTPVDPKKNPPKMKRVGSLGLFFRKFYHLASVRLLDLCDRLEIADDERRKKFWTCFEHCIINHTDLMMDRHLDQIIMCSIYVMDKVTKNNTSFQDIMKYYRAQPQAASHVYRSVLLFTKERHASGSSSSDGGSKNETSESNSPIPMDKEEDEKRKLRLAIRSSSTLPTDHLSYSQPQTPTQLAGTSASFKDEDRGDLITFYNKVFGFRMQSFVLKFTATAKKNSETPPLSPLPVPKSYNMSPRRQVSSQHSVFISPLRSTPSPSRLLSYSFSQSPSKNLQAINNMVRLGSDEPAAKRACMDHTLRRIQSVITERQGVRGAPLDGGAQNGEATAPAVEVTV